MERRIAANIYLFIRFAVPYYFTHSSSNENLAALQLIGMVYLFAAEYLIIIIYFLFHEHRSWPSQVHDVVELKKSSLCRTTKLKKEASVQVVLTLDNKKQNKTKFKIY